MKTTRMPVPDGLVERVMIARGYPRRWHYTAAAAAAGLLLAISAVTLLTDVLEPAEPTVAAHAVGAAHPAVAAISMVVDQEPGLLRDRQHLEAREVQERLKFVGLALKTAGVSARYIGKCAMGAGDCDHVVLATPDGHVSVFLMAHEHAIGSVLVADRRMTALLTPAPTGAYIVVAASAKAARRAQKLFVHG